MTKGKLVTFQWLARNPHSWTEQEEVDMTRTAIRPVLSALAAAALVAVCASDPVSAGNTYVDAGLYGSDEMFVPSAGGTDVK